jgi:eukaryotic-like serine/threonine-protein kinase
MNANVNVSLAVGTVVGQRYEVVRSLGSGSTGAVYAARDTSTGKDVALKVLHADLLFDEDTMRRFLSEARTTSQIRSPHVASVYECGALDSGQPFIVLELLVGRDLEEVRERDGSLSVDDTVSFMLQCLAGLSAAHVAGFVHRDLKPANLFVIEGIEGIEGEGASSPTPKTLKILDFGLAKAVKDHARSLTKTHSVFGTPAYIAPEQLKSSKHVDCRADIWSVGVVIYELLTNHLPFDGSDLESYVRAVMDGPPTPLTRHRSDLPPGLAEVIERCLQKRPSDRFATGPELARALAPFAPPHCRAVLEEIERVADSEARTVAVDHHHHQQQQQTSSAGAAIGKEDHQRTLLESEAVLPHSERKPGAVPLKLIVLLALGGVALLLAMGFVGFLLSGM